MSRIPLLGPPRPLSGGQSTYSSSLFGAVADLCRTSGETSSREREYSIDLSTQEAVASTLDHVMTDYFRDGTISHRQGGVYGDGSFAIFVHTTVTFFV